MKTKILSRENLDTKLATQLTLIDKAYNLDQEIKEKVIELTKMKEELKLQAQMEEKHELEGVYSKGVFTDAEDWDIDSDLLIEWLKKNKKKDLMQVIFKPAVGEIKKYLGETCLKEFGKKTIKKYNKLSLKKR